MVHPQYFIITKSISRFARNTTDCLELVRKLLGLDICIYFEKENLNTGAMESELMLSILSSLAENESVSISQNSKWAVKKRFQNGTFVISYPPYGYDNVEGEMVVVPEQAQIVQRIFQDTLSGKSTHAISKELNEEGIRTKKGGRWMPGAGEPSSGGCITSRAAATWHSAAQTTWRTRQPAR